MLLKMTILLNGYNVPKVLIIMNSNQANKLYNNLIIIIDQSYSKGIS